MNRLPDKISLENSTNERGCQSSYHIEVGIKQVYETCGKEGITSYRELIAQFSEAAYQQYLKCFFKLQLGFWNLGYILFTFYVQNNVSDKKFACKSCRINWNSSIVYGNILFKWYVYKVFRQEIRRNFKLKDSAVRLICNFL